MVVGDLGGHSEWSGSVSTSMRIPVAGIVEDRQRRAGYSPAEREGQHKPFSWGWFWFWLIICWPAAIIYVAMRRNAP